MWDTGYPAADKSEVGMWYVQALKCVDAESDIEESHILDQATILIFSDVILTEPFEKYLGHPVM